MIFVRIELWPHGDKKRKRCLGEATIANTGGGTAEAGNYEFVLSKFGGFGPRMGNKWKQGKVEGFPRKKLGPWDLLTRVIDVARKGGSLVEVGPLPSPTYDDTEWLEQLANEKRK